MEYSMSERYRNPDRDRYRPGPIEGNFHPTARVGGGVGYIGDGNYSSGEYEADAPPDYAYDYAGFKGDAGIDDEYGSNQYGGGRYGQGPFEQSQQYGGDGFSTGRGPFGALQKPYGSLFLGHVPHPDGDTWTAPRYHGFSQDQIEGSPQTELSGVTDWRNAPDIANPSGFRIYHSRDRADRNRRRGPKGYRRSDERILEDIYEHLLGTYHLDTSDVRIEVHDGVATLTGSVPERRMKHAIEDLVHDIRDVKDVDNRIRVERFGSDR
jgi:hypothetical protein